MLSRIAPLKNNGAILLMGDGWIGLKPGFFLGGRTYEFWQNMAQINALHGKVATTIATNMEHFYEHSL